MSHGWVSSFVTCAGYAALFGLTVVSAAIAQPSEPPPAQKADDTITVTGQKLEKKEARAQALEFVSKHTTRLGNQFARRTVPSCARVVGIDEGYAKIVQDKVNAVGRAAGLMMEGGACKPNLHILFTSDANALMTQLRKAKPSLFDFVEPRQRGKLYNDPVPVRWWYINDVIDAHDYKSTARANADGTAPIVDRTIVSPKISTGVVIDIAGTVVVVDIKQAEGYPLESIAAYAAMVSFAQLRPSGTTQGSSSIMSMFASATDRVNAPLDLTNFDYAYIRGLYAILPDRIGGSQRGRIATKMAARLSNTDSQRSK
jgi:hypothetical protein